MMLTGIRKLLQRLADAITDWNYSDMIGSIELLHRAQRVGWSVGYIDKTQGVKIYNSLGDVPDCTTWDDLQQVIYLKARDE